MQLHDDQLPNVHHQPESLVPIRLLDLLGSGGSATVFRAERRLANQPLAAAERVAVKLPNAGISLRDEAAALARFVHPNIVTMLDDHTDHDRGEFAGSIVVELCENGTLEDLVMQRALSAGEVHFVVTSIGSALSAVHAGGWIHGDVTPSNIGLRSSQPPCLFDFDSCRRVANDIPSGTKGTPGFTEPLLASSPVFDARSLAKTALWSLGAPEEFSTDDHRVASGLRSFIEECDQQVAPTGRSIRDPDYAPLSDLYNVFSNVPATPIAVSLPTRVASTVRDPNDPARPRTRPFGPRPGDVDEPANAPQPSQRPSRKRQIAAVGAAVALLCLVSIELGGSSPAAATAPAPPAPAPLETSSTTAATKTNAEETLTTAGVAWSSEHGSAHVVLDGVATSFAPGQRGDLGAIGDWNCDGTETLGIFRPSTGTWFTFDGWTPNATSTVEIITDPNSDDEQLMVHTRSDGCDYPALQ